MRVRKVAYALGAELLDCDLREALDEPSRQALRQALLDHQVLVLHDQQLTPEQLLRFTGYLGPVATMRDSGETLAGHPLVIRLDNEEGSVTKAYGGNWHSDGMDFQQTPDGATILHCIECPSVGSDTEFVSQYLVFETLSVAYQTLLRGLRWHVERMPDVAHPLVRTSPETGRDYLYLSPASTRFCGMSPQESKGILDFLMTFRTDDRFMYRHRWRPGDIVVWENRATLHRVVDDTDFSERRVMHRTRTTGTLSGTLVDPSSGDPLDRPIEPTDILRLVGKSTHESHTTDSGALEHVVRTPESEFVLESSSPDVKAIIERAIATRRFFAREALSWSVTGLGWPAVRKILAALCSHRLLHRDLFGPRCRTLQPGQAPEPGIQVMRALAEPGESPRPTSG